MTLAVSWVLYIVKIVSTFTSVESQWNKMSNVRIAPGFRPLVIYNVNVNSSSYFVVHNKGQTERLAEHWNTSASRFGKNTFYVFTGDTRFGYNALLVKSFQFHGYVLKRSKTFRRTCLLKIYSLHYIYYALFLQNFLLKKDVLECNSDYFITE